MGVVRIYHGSEVAIPKPDLKKCKPHNDYGPGFYCTEDMGLAREWACWHGRNGIVSTYDVDITSYEMMDLNCDDYSVLHWLEMLLENRVIKLSYPIMVEASRWIRENFTVEVSGADFIHGYRADDAYFSFAKAFLRNEISLTQLQRAMKLGNLGTQIMAKSPAAFQALQYQGSEPVDGSLYGPRQQQREQDAYLSYMQMLAEPFDKRGLYINDLMRLDKEEIYEYL